MYNPSSTMMSGGHVSGSASGGGGNRQQQQVGNSNNYSSNSTPSDYNYNNINESYSNIPPPHHRQSSSGGSGGYAQQPNSDYQQRVGGSYPSPQQQYPPPQSSSNSNNSNNNFNYANSPSQHAPRSNHAPTSGMPPPPSSRAQSNNSQPGGSGYSAAGAPPLHRHTSMSSTSSAGSTSGNRANHTTSSSSSSSSNYPQSPGADWNQKSVSSPYDASNISPPRSKAALPPAHSSSTGATVPSGGKGKKTAAANANAGNSAANIVPSVDSSSAVADEPLVRPPRIDLLSRKQSIDSLLNNNPTASQAYWSCIERYLLVKLSKQELDDTVKKILGERNIYLHNEFIQGILQNALSDELPKLVPKKKVASANGTDETTATTTSPSLTATSTKKKVVALSPADSTTTATTPATSAKKERGASKRTLSPDSKEKKKLEAKERAAAKRKSTTAALLDDAATTASTSEKKKATRKSRAKGGKEDEEVSSVNVWLHPANWSANAQHQQMKHLLTPSDYFHALELQTNGGPVLSEQRGIYGAGGVDPYATSIPNPNQHVLAPPTLPPPNGNHYSPPSKLSASNTATLEYSQRVLNGLYQPQLRPRSSSAIEPDNPVSTSTSIMTPTLPAPYTSSYLNHLSRSRSSASASASASALVSARHRSRTWDTAFSGLALDEEDDENSEDDEMDGSEVDSDDADELDAYARLAEGRSSSLYAPQSRLLPDFTSIKRRVYLSAQRHGIRHVNEQAVIMIQRAMEQHLRSIITSILDFARPNIGGPIGRAAAAAVPLPVSVAASADPSSQLNRTVGSSSPGTANATPDSTFLPVSHPLLVSTASSGSAIATPMDISSDVVASSSVVVTAPTASHMRGLSVVIPVTPAVQHSNLPSGIPAHPGVSSHALISTPIPAPSIMHPILSAAALSVSSATSPAIALPPSMELSDVATVVTEAERLIRLRYALSQPNPRPPPDPLTQPQLPVPSALSIYMQQQQPKPQPSPHLLEPVHLDEIISEHVYANRHTPDQCAQLLRREKITINA